MLDRSMIRDIRSIDVRTRSMTIDYRSIKTCDRSMHGRVSTILKRKAKR
ncbi:MULTISPECIES: hypothetical protein [unclassified Sporosarcina]|nr:MULTISPECIES: hypothetical protein [unclassified Sporosarcina]